MKTILVAVCIVQHEGKVPLIKFKRNYMAGLWGLPGGKLDDDEHLAEGAARELQEELGITTELEQSLATVDEIAIDKEGAANRFVLLICRMRSVGEVATLKRELPEGTIQWFTPDEIEALKPEMVPSDYHILHKLSGNTEQSLYRSKQEWDGEKLVLKYFEKVG